MSQNQEVNYGTLTPNIKPNQTFLDSLEKHIIFVSQLPKNMKLLKMLTMVEQHHGEYEEW